MLIYTVPAFASLDGTALPEIVVTVEAWTGNVRPWRAIVEWTPEDGRTRRRYSGACSTSSGALRSGERLANSIRRIHLAETR